MDKIIDTIIFMIFNNNIISKTEKTEFLKKLIKRLNEPYNSSESESDSDEDYIDIIEEEFEVQENNGFCEIK